MMQQLPNGTYLERQTSGLAAVSVEQVKLLLQS